MEPRNRPDTGEKRPRAYAQVSVGLPVLASKKTYSNPMQWSLNERQDFALERLQSKKAPSNEPCEADAILSK